MSCPSCGSTAVFRDTLRGEEVCTRCGLVILERVVEPGSEFQRIPDENACVDPTVGEDPSLHDLGLGSQFRIPSDLPPSARARLRRMRFAHLRSRTPPEQRTLKAGLMVISNLCRELGLPLEMKREISQLYRRARVRGLTAGRSQLILSLALYHLVCRLRGFPVRERETVEFLTKRGIQEEKALRKFRAAVKVLSRGLGIRAKPPSAPEYVDKYASMLGLPPEVSSRAREMCLELRLSRAPHVLACAALYRAAKQSGYRLTLPQLSTQFGLGLSNLSRVANVLERMELRREPSAG